VARRNTDLQTAAAPATAPSAWAGAVVAVARLEPAAADSEGSRPKVARVAVEAACPSVAWTAHLAATRAKAAVLAARTAPCRATARRAFGVARVASAASAAPQALAEVSPTAAATTPAAARTARRAVAKDPAAPSPIATTRAHACAGSGSAPPSAAEEPGDQAAPAT